MGIKAICVTGLPGSGKTILNEIANSMGIPTFTMGEVVFEETKKRGLKTTSENVAYIAKKLREELGKDAVAKLIVKKIKEKLENKNKDQWILIDGLRSEDEYKLFKKHFQKTVLITVLASQETRYKRLLERGREDVEKTEKDLVKRDLREISFGIPKLAKQSDIFIVNERISLEEFKEKAKQIISKILKGEQKW